MPASRLAAVLLCLVPVVTALPVVGPGASAAALEPPTTRTAASAGEMAGIAAGIGTDVVGDDENDLYRGTGGLLVPEDSWRSDGGSRSEIAGCGDCEWRLTRLCTKDEQAAGGCRRIDIGCPVGTVPVRVWLRHVGGDWVVVGRMCQGDRPPRTVTDVGTEVRDEAEELLPELRLRVQPAAAALVRLPVVGRTGQPAQGIRDADLSVLGLDVSLDARVRWRWDWSDGDPVWESVPGGRWPDTSVSHTYRVAGPRAISATSVWRGEFRVEGLGPFAVPGPPLTQSASLQLEVREGRAVLTR